MAINKDHDDKITADNARKSIAASTAIAEAELRQRDPKYATADMNSAHKGHLDWKKAQEQVQAVAASNPFKSSVTAHEGQFNIAPESQNTSPSESATMVKSVISNLKRDAKEYPTGNYAWYGLLTKDTNSPTEAAENLAQEDKLGAQSLERLYLTGNSEQKEELTNKITGFFNEKSELSRRFTKAREDIKAEHAALGGDKGGDLDNARPILQQAEKLVESAESKFAAAGEIVKGARNQYDEERIKLASTYHAPSNHLPEKLAKNTADLKQIDTYLAKLEGKPNTPIIPTLPLIPTLGTILTIPFVNDAIPFIVNKGTPLLNKAIPLINEVTPLLTNKALLQTQRNELIHQKEAFIEEDKKNPAGHIITINDSQKRLEAYASLHNEVVATQAALAETKAAREKLYTTHLPSRDKVVVGADQEQFDALTKEIGVLSVKLKRRHELTQEHAAHFDLQLESVVAALDNSKTAAKDTPGYVDAVEALKNKRKHYEEEYDHMRTQARDTFKEKSYEALSGARDAYFDVRQAEATNKKAESIRTKNMTGAEVANSEIVLIKQQRDQSAAHSVKSLAEGAGEYQKRVQLGVDARTALHSNELDAFKKVVTSQIGKIYEQKKGVAIAEALKEAKKKDEIVPPDELKAIADKLEVKKTEMLAELDKRTGDKRMLKQMHIVEEKIGQVPVDQREGVRTELFEQALNTEKKFDAADFLRSNQWTERLAPTELAKAVGNLEFNIKDVVWIDVLENNQVRFVQSNAPKDGRDVEVHSFTIDVKDTNNLDFKGFNKLQMVTYDINAGINEENKAITYHLPRNAKVSAIRHPSTEYANQEASSYERLQMAEVLRNVKSAELNPASDMQRAIYASNYEYNARQQDNPIDQMLVQKTAIDNMVNQRAATLAELKKTNPDLADSFAQLDPKVAQAVGMQRVASANADPASLGNQDVQLVRQVAQDTDASHSVRR